MVKSTDSLLDISTIPQSAPVLSNDTDLVPPEGGWMSEAEEAASLQWAAQFRDRVFTDAQKLFDILKRISKGGFKTLIQILCDPKNRIIREENLRAMRMAARKAMPMYLAYPRLRVPVSLYRNCTVNVTRSLADPDKITDVITPSGVERKRLGDLDIDEMRLCLDPKKGLLKATEIYARITERRKAKKPVGANGDCYDFDRAFRSKDNSDYVVVVLREGSNRDVARVQLTKKNVETLLRMFK